MSLLASFMNLAGPDLIVILLIVLVLFGAKKLPELARGMGQAVREFQKAKDEFSDELNKAGKTEEKTVHPAQANVPRIEPGTPGATSPTRTRPSLPVTAPIKFRRLLRALFYHPEQSRRIAKGFQHVLLLLLVLMLRRRRSLDVQRSQCGAESCHLRSPEPWLSLISLGVEPV